MNKPNVLDYRWWDSAPVWAECVAMDEDGKWYFYESEPRLLYDGINQWQENYLDDCHEAILCRSHELPEIDNSIPWDQRLYTRVNPPKSDKPQSHHEFDKRAGDYTVKIDDDGTEHWKSVDGRREMLKKADGSYSLSECDERMNIIHRYNSLSDVDYYWTYDDMNRAVYYRTASEEVWITHGFNGTKMLSRYNLGDACTDRNHKLEYRLGVNLITEDEYKEINDGSLFRDRHVVVVNGKTFRLTEIIDEND